VVQEKCDQATLKLNERIRHMTGSTALSGAQDKLAKDKLAAETSVHQCTGMKEGKCSHLVRYNVDGKFFCHLHNPSKEVHKCVATEKCKASGKYIVNGQRFCYSHKPGKKEDWQGCEADITETASGEECKNQGVHRNMIDDDGTGEWLCGVHDKMRNGGRSLRD